MNVLLAGLAVAIDAPPAIAADLARRYAGYETSAPADLTCAVRVVEGLAIDVDDRDYPAAIATAEGVRYHILRRDLEAHIDLDARTLAVTARPLWTPIDAALRVAVSLLLPRRGGLLLHSSGVVEAGRAHLFSGRSGAGKTTAVRLLAPRPPLGDDLVALLPDGATFRAHAIPFAGEYGPVAPRSAPLGRLFFLEQADEHRAIPIAAAEARARILRNTLAYVREADTAGLLQDVAARLAAAVPCARLRFRRDPGFGALLAE